MARVCLKCTRRYIGFHAHCKEYAAETVENARKRDARHKAAELRHDYNAFKSTAIKAGSHRTARRK